MFIWFIDPEFMKHNFYLLIYFSIEVYQEKNAEKREQMDRTKQSTEKLEKELCHGQKLVTHYKDSIKRSEIWIETNS